MKLFSKATKNWKECFAWLPVETEQGNIIWLQKCYKKLHYPIIEYIKPFPIYSEVNDESIK